MREQRTIVLNAGKSTDMYFINPKRLVIWAEIDKMLVRIANKRRLRSDCFFKQSDLGLHCLSSV